MTMQDDKRRKSPADRFRNIMSAEQGKETAPTARVYPKGTTSAALNLPKPGGEPDGPVEVIEVRAAAPRQQSSASGIGAYLPAFWTIASIISLLFNVVLLVLVIGLLRSFGSLDASKIGTAVLGGLYSNFERMDQAHIKATIPLQTSIPLDFTVPVQTTTGITLAKPVSIPGAHVRINTSLFNIDAPANVTLPAGTTMDVALSFAVPVQTQIPVALSVPVDIPLQTTDLHPALVGLQDTIRPVYCMITPLAKALNGEPVCK